METEKLTKAEERKFERFLRRQKRREEIEAKKQNQMLNILNLEIQLEQNRFLLNETEQELLNFDKDEDPEN
jgi:hypothetical protein